MSTDMGPGPGYEFSEKENATIKSLAWFMKLTGIILIVAGVLAALGGIASGENLLAGLLQGAFSIVVGLLQYRASTAFSTVVATHGNDILHLMSALGTLRTLYKLQIIAIAAAVIIGVIAGLMSAS